MAFSHAQSMTVHDTLELILDPDTIFMKAPINDNVHIHVDHDNRLTLCVRVEWINSVAP